MTAGEAPHGLRHSRGSGNPPVRSASVKEVRAGSSLLFRQDSPYPNTDVLSRAAAASRARQADHRSSWRLPPSFETTPLVDVLPRPAHLIENPHEAAAEAGGRVLYLNRRQGSECGRGTIPCGLSPATATFRLLRPGFPKGRSGKHDRCVPGTPLHRPNPAIGYSSLARAPTRWSPHCLKAWKGVEMTARGI